MSLDMGLQLWFTNPPGACSYRDRITSRVMIGGRLGAKHKLSFVRNCRHYCPVRDEECDQWPSID